MTKKERSLREGRAERKESRQEMVARASSAVRNATRRQSTVDYFCIMYGVCFGWDERKESKYYHNGESEMRERKRVWV